MCGEADDPEGYEGDEAGDNVKHAGWVGAMVGVKVGLDGVVEREKDDQEKRAAEPGEPTAEVFERGGGLLWG